MWAKNVYRADRQLNKK